ncbi:equatorin [Psammomys obesus]|uniref:equatorin n=1 Tax=Psammomys obesus TaxID=48139 RepID=UPI002452D952|nr:equatorin [Psammomys obesus]
MDFVLLIFLSGVFLSDISNLQSIAEQDSDEIIPSYEEQFYSDDATTANNVPVREEDKPVVQKPEVNEDEAPANEKTGNYYKDIKHYVFTTHSTLGSESELSVTATTEVSVKAYKLTSATAAEEKYIKRTSKDMQRSTPNVPAFWTMLAKAITGNAQPFDEKDQLFRAVPSSDFNTTNGDKLSELEEIKLKLMLGISLLTLILLIPLLIFCCATLCKLRKLSEKNYDNQYSINPELANMSYFHPSEGVSDTSFSKSAESSLYWGNAPSDMRHPSTRKSRSKSMDFSSSYNQGTLNEEEMNEQTFNENNEYTESGMVEEESQSLTK